jgi:hypothetical protein
MSFDPYNHLLKIQEYIRTSTLKVGVHLGVRGFIHALTLSYIPRSMKCDSRASFLAHPFAIFCLSREPKTRVTTI